MDKPENYYTILGVPIDADNDTIKRAYRQLARRYHPDLAGPAGALEMKRINRAYSVLSDPEKRVSYDTIIAGSIDLRRFVRPQPRAHTFNPVEDVEFEGLQVFSSRGPLRAGPLIHSQLGVTTTLSSAHTGQGLLIAAGSLDGKGKLWHVHEGQATIATTFEAEPSLTVESLRELRFSEGGTLLAGWGRLHLHVWDALNGERLWHHGLQQRAVSAHFSLDMTLQASPNGHVHMALPLLPSDGRAPNAWGVRGTDVITHNLHMSPTSLAEPLTCIEEGIDNR
ncbi:MAG: J domain-containing protein, partial [Ktedonobacteraceae bacterium]|nr:J domain-containing protein [Ktedonobacteraceae bacterium]